MPVFQYEPLDTTKSEIRLLDLLPDQDAIRCTMRHVSLPTNLQYEALSYCWGTMVRTVKITVNGDDLFITKNLYSALVRLRHKQRIKTLWIDALCINQKNIPEKNIQVPLMRTIYQSCMRVVIWIGEENSYTKSAFQALEFMAARKEANPDEEIIGTQWKAAQRGETSKRGLFPKLRSRLETLEGIQILGSIFERAWFKRVWIIQELAVSPDAVVVCGTFETAWRTVEKAYELSNAVFDMEDHLSDLVSFRKNWQCGISYDLFVHVMLGWNQSATDSRDKIYAVMGLVSNKSTQIPLKVDYKQDPKEIFLDFTQQYISLTKNLDILGFCRGCRNTDDWNPPSWALDDEYDKATQPFPQHSLSSVDDSIESTKGFCAGGKKKGQPLLSASGTLLRLRGAHLETITDVSVEFAYATPEQSIRGVAIDPWTNLAKFVASYLDARRICDVGQGKTYPYTGQSLRDAFWQTLQVFEDQWADGADSAELLQECVDFDDFAVRASDTLVAGDAKLAGVLKNLQLHVAVARDILSPKHVVQSFFVKAYAAWKRRFVRLGKSYIGLGPKKTRVGDKVVLLEGRKVPLVIRAVGKRWRVVGDCYVHGVMKGEAFSPESCQLLWFE
ncbi:hypothetical protein QQZ08_000294 [Neonectria magnoliae]|uniref:Heterokaryon incompatibility domain-containing protein n=1 Tax=Neonectria magnoliae TaxID=2732573 RepID=A0ABR1IKP9_9HYPO